MQLSHTPAATSAVFDDPNLIGSAGLVPILRLAETAGLGALADERLSVPTDKGANAGAKVSALVAGMVAGADSIEDMALLRHGGMGRVFGRCYAPSTLGSFLRTFTFGHVRQLDAVASRFLTRLAMDTPLVAGVSEVAVVDIDDTIVEVHGYAKQGAGFGYTKVRGLNALIATVSTESCAPVIVAQRLRKGSANSARGAQRLVRDALKTTRTLVRGAGGPGPGRVLVRADSAYYGHPVIGAAVKTGAEVSVTVRLDKRVKAAISAIADDAWTTIEYPRAVFDEDSNTWISSAQVAEVPYVAFTSKKKTQVPGRLVVRRIPDANAEKKKRAGQDGLFELWRHHAFFTTTPEGIADTVAVDKVHRAHAIIEQVHADLKSSALAHLPSGKFTANAAWLVLAVMAFNLTRAAATLTDARRLARATTPTVRRTLVHVPARVATSARRLTLHLPRAWPWQHAWTVLFERVHAPPATIAP
ncbi:IS1380 family transposase [Nostocoides sp. F2B08]|uniref:IS1380 family transposase n=1 Tax=Nostocoides sp. F2B08 TaxID=2653936 RepID=UPI0012630568|nr:IS1380 family transposase [Tetrasphaera sp. F2B08]KAB7739046.1 IS1380 family transposase [Tetrasphaera sp. F2B08]